MCHYYPLGEFFFKDFIYLFLERGEGREKERERNINVWLLLMWPPLRTWPTIQACALTGNRTGDRLVHSLSSLHWATPATAPLGELFSYYLTIVQTEEANIAWRRGLCKFTRPSTDHTDVRGCASWFPDLWLMGTLYHTNVDQPRSSIYFCVQ